MVSKCRLTDKIQYTTDRKLQHDNDEYRVVVSFSIAGDDIDYEVMFCNKTNTFKFNTVQHYKLHTIPGSVASFLSIGFLTENPYFKVSNRRLDSAIENMTDGVVSRWLKDHEVMSP